MQLGSTHAFADHVVLVTGGAAGIGRALVEVFRDEGADVFFADIDQTRGDATAAATGAHFVAADVATLAGARALVDAALAARDRIDVLVNNAGISHAADFLDLTEADFDRVLGVNLKSYFLCGQLAARAMVARQTRGAIINVSSVNGILAIANQVPYVVSKGAINQLTKVMALALAPHGIRVNGIGPGTIGTELAQKAVLGSPEAKHKILSRTPLGRLGEASEIAGVVAFLASPLASYMTGQTIYVDGGRLALNYTVPVPESVG